MATTRTRIREVHIVQDDVTLAWHVCQVPITEFLNDDGGVVAASYGSAQAVDLDNVSEALSGAFVDITQERDAAVAARQAAETERDDAIAAKEAAEAQLAALQPTPEA